MCVIVDVVSGKRQEAYLYIRMSTTEQSNGDSLRRQFDLGKNYARDHGLWLPDTNILEDIGLSAYTGDNVTRGKLGSFLRDVEDGKIKSGGVLLVESLDRITRQLPLDGLLLVFKILKKGMTIVSFADGKIYDEANSDLPNLISSLLAIARSNQESETKSLRVTQAWMRKRANISSRKLTKLCPSWFQLNSSRTAFQIIPNRRKIIERLFLESSGGLGTCAIASRLNREKVPTFGRSKGWAYSTINRFLTTRAVLGEFQPGQKKKKSQRKPIGEPVVDYFPAIISPELFMRVQQARRARRIMGMGGKGTAYKNLFTRVAVCGVCGDPMHYIDKGSPPKGGTYLCCSGVRRHTCNAKPWDYKLFERYFLSHVAELDLKSLFSSEPTETDGVRQAIDYKTEQMADLELKLHKLMEELLGPNKKSEFLSNEFAKLEAVKAGIFAETQLLERHYEKLLAQADAASDTDHKTLLLDLQIKDENQMLKRAKVAQRIRVLFEEIRVFPQIQDKAVILNWANKQVTEMSLAEAKLTIDHAKTPMFDVTHLSKKESRFFLNYSP